MTMAVASPRRQSPSEVVLMGIAGQVPAILRRRRAGHPLDQIDDLRLDRALALTRQTLRVMRRVRTGDFREATASDSVWVLWNFVMDREPTGWDAQLRQLGLQHRALWQLRRHQELPPPTIESLFEFWGGLFLRVM